MKIRLRPSGAYHPVRCLYLGYYLKGLDREKYEYFLKQCGQDTGRSSLSLAIESIFDGLRFNVSLLEYFQFGFPSLESNKKMTWAGSGYMYEYQRVMNPPSTRRVLDDKREFFRRYSQFIVHKVFTREELESDASTHKALFGASNGKIVLKASDGKCGAQVEIIDASAWGLPELLSRMHEGGYDMAEEFIVQHAELQRLSPSAVNTVRIITQLNAENEVEILGCRLRISVDSPVDNLAAGNICAPIDESNGIVCGPAIYSDPWRQPETKHPVTDVSIVGFRVPRWEECLSLARSAALHDPSNRSIGWDIVVTENGPGLIEGNHDWCKLVWQLPVEKGLRPVLDRHWREYASLEKNI